MANKLILVGAGPGDPDLISYKGIKALREADVVMYDALVNTAVLDHCKKDAVKLYVGKRAGEHSHTQDEIHALILKQLTSHKKVVRLKGGDPFVFAHGQEEIDMAHEHGFDAEAILGISSITLPGYYGIPLTKRGTNESFWVVTATTKRGELSKDMELVAKSTATAIIFMGLHKLSQIVDTFKQYRGNNTPVGIISKGSREDGKLFLATLDTVVAKKERSDIKPPSLIVIGDVVGNHSYYYEQLLEDSRLDL